MATIFFFDFKNGLHCNFHTCHFNIVILKYLIHNESENRHWAEPKKGGIHYGVYLKNEKSVCLKT